MMRHLGFLLALFAFWLFLSGMLVPFFIAAGVGSALGVAALAWRMKVADHECHPAHLAWAALLSYWPWLAGEIIRSAWDVARRVLHPGLPISPTLVEFRPAQRSDLGLVIHANSITLTPGTITVEAEPGRFLVHALTREGAQGLAGSEMDRRCAALETSS